jgi:hypothetical protein
MRHIVVSNSNVPDSDMHACTALDGGVKPLINVDCRSGADSGEVDVFEIEIM